MHSGYIYVFFFVFFLRYLFHQCFFLLVLLQSSTWSMNFAHFLLFKKKYLLSVQFSPSMKWLATFTVAIAHFFLCAFPSGITAQLLQEQCSLRKYSQELSLAAETQLSLRKLSCALKTTEQMAFKTTMFFKKKEICIFSPVFKVSCEKRLSA